MRSRHQSCSLGWVADLVDERQGAGFPLEDETGVAPHHRLDLHLDLRRHAQGRERLHIEAAIGLAAASGPRVRGATTRPVAADGRRRARHRAPAPSGRRSFSSSTRWHSTQRSSSGRTPSASARPDLEPARHATRIHAVVEQLAGSAAAARRRGGHRHVPRPLGRRARRGTRRWPSSPGGRAGAARRGPR